MVNAHPCLRFSEHSHPEEALQYCKRIFQYHFTEYFLYPVSSHNKDVSQRNKDTRQQPYCIRQQPYQMSPCRQGRNKPPYLPLIFTLFLRTENCEDSLRGYSSFDLKPTNGHEGGEWARIFFLNTCSQMRYWKRKFVSIRLLRETSWAKSSPLRG